MAEELNGAFGVEANLVPGSKGIFDVIVDGKLVFSKYETGRFPEKDEVAGRIKR